MLSHSACPCLFLILPRYHRTEKGRTLALKKLNPPSKRERRREGAERRIFPDLSCSPRSLSLSVKNRNSKRGERRRPEVSCWTQRAGSLDNGFAFGSREEGLFFALHELCVLFWCWICIHVVEPRRRASVRPSFHLPASK